MHCFYLGIKLCRTSGLIYLPAYMYFKTRFVYCVRLERALQVALQDGYIKYLQWLLQTINGIPSWSVQFGRMTRRKIAGAQ